MPRFKLTIEYAGTRYSGWQIQKNARTVQGEIDRAVRRVLATDRFELYGAGRTDAGVHALGQVAHLDVVTRLDPEGIRRAVNDELPADINVLALETVTRRFHARHGAVARSYLYQIARRRTAFGKPFVWWVKDPLQLDAMCRAAALFTGLRDFRSFTDDEPDEKSTEVLLERLELAEAGGLVLIRVRGSHFLWKMVRRLVGVLVHVGRGQLPIDEVSRLLERASDTPARLTAPPSGLFLERVYYEEGEPDPPLEPAFSIRAHASTFPSQAHLEDS
jgi:tRNA pseudouridine38-40 synthase